MRISDWSSDVCSSDLLLRQLSKPQQLPLALERTGRYLNLRYPITLLKIMAQVLILEQQLEQLTTVLSEYNFSIILQPGLISRLVVRSEEHTSELQSLMRISYAVFCLKKKKMTITHYISNNKINKT